jgi:hypothetical protein
MYDITLMQLSVPKTHITAYPQMFQGNPEKCMKTVFGTYQKENKMLQVKVKMRLCYTTTLHHMPQGGFTHRMLSPIPFPCHAVR